MDGTGVKSASNGRSEERVEEHVDLKRRTVKIAHGGWTGAKPARINSSMDCPIPRNSKKTNSRFIIIIKMFLFL